MKTGYEEYNWNGRGDIQSYCGAEKGEYYHPKQYLSLPTFLLVGQPRLEHYTSIELIDK